MLETQGADPWDFEAWEILAKCELMRRLYITYYFNFFYCLFSFFWPKLQNRQVMVTSFCWRRSWGLPELQLLQFLQRPGKESEGCNESRYCTFWIFSRVCKYAIFGPSKEKTDFTIYKRHFKFVPKNYLGILKAQFAPLY